MNMFGKTRLFLAEMLHATSLRSKRHIHLHIHLPRRQVIGDGIFVVLDVFDPIIRYCVADLEEVEEVLSLFGYIHTSMC
jgi:hypothetical protein